MDRRRERRNDIDWLRFFTICAVFLFHCARFFDDGYWHVKNAQSDFGMTVFVSVLVQWIMPIFFILSGLASYYGLAEKQRSGVFLKDRFKRLIIPLVFAIFTMIPLQVYFERVSHHQFTGTYLDFYPHYFDGFYGFGGNFAWMGLHLWYLLFLFIFTFLTIPLLVFFKKPGGQKAIGVFADFSEKPGAIFLLFLFTTFTDFALMPDSPVGFRDMGGWNLMTYLIIYIIGYILAGDIRLKVTIQRHRGAALTIGLATYALFYYWLVELGAPPADYNGSYFIFTAVRCLNSWSLIIAILGYGSKYMAFNNRFLKYATQLILPFYILHQTVIITIGFFVVQWDMSITLKYIIISTSSLIVIMVLYELLIKRFDILRFLFGLKRR